MKRIENAEHPKIELLFDMLRDVSRQTDPNEAIATFSRRYWRIRPMAYSVAVSTRDLEDGQYKITRRFIAPTDHNGDAEFSQTNPWDQWDTLQTHSGGFIGAAISMVEPQVYTDLDLSDDPVLSEFDDARSAIVIPSFDQGNVYNWLVVLRREPEAFTLDDLLSNLLTANLIGGMTKSLLAVREISALHARLDAQLQEVARVQQSLLPRRIPDIPGVRLATSYFTSDEAGGDYYDFFPFADGRWGILIADVAGHGAAAATVMAMLHAILHAYPGAGARPHEIMAYANERLVAAQLEGSFVTAFFGVFDPESRRLSFCRAGHPPPRHKSGRDGGVTDLCGAGTLPLGILPDLETTCETIVLEPKDTLVLYTDGITEAFDSKREMFGVDRLDAALHTCSGDPDCVVDSVHGALYAFNGLLTRDDDQTLVALQTFEAQASETP